MIAVRKSSTECKAPRRFWRRVMAEKKPSTALSHEAEVRCEMEHPARMIGQPFEDVGLFVGGVVVDDGVDDFSGRDGAPAAHV